MLFVVGLGVFLASLSGARAVPYEEVTQHHAALEAGKRLIVRHSYGSVVLRSGDKQGVTVLAKRHLDGSREAIQKYLQGLKVNVKAVPDGVEVSTDRPAGEPKGMTQTTVDLEITLPAGVPAKVDTSFGDLDAQGVGGITATVRFGAIRLQDIAGDVTIDGRSGEVTIKSVEGDVTVTTSSGSVDASAIGGSLTVRNQFAQVRAAGIGRHCQVDNRNGAISLLNVGGGVEATCQNGQIEVSRVQGGATITNSGDSITISKAQGAIDIKNHHGAVDIRDVSGTLTVQNNTSPVRVKQVRGSASVTNARGLIDVDSVTGDCTLRNDFNMTNVRDVGGALKASITQGIIEATLSPAQANKDAGEWEIKANHSNVKLWVPAGAGMDLQATVNAGSIRSEFQIKKGRAGNGETCQAKINGGGAKVTVTLDLGDVQIKKVPAGGR